MHLNDTSSALALLQSRRSGRPADLVAPGPDEAQLATILTAAARTPDHGRLFPWRFIVVGQDQRAALEALLVDALPDSVSDPTPAHVEKARGYARNAPALVVLVSAPLADHKIPVFEQQLSCGAAAMNLLLAAHALGFVGAWITGWPAYSEKVRAAFCAPGERIAGLLYLGTPREALEERPRAPLPTVVRQWAGPET